MKRTFLVRLTAGPNHNRTRSVDEDSLAREHAAFIQGLIAEGFLIVGGAVDDGGNGVMIVRAETGASVRHRLERGPLQQRGILRLESVARWEIPSETR